MWRVLRQRNFAFLWTGGLISLIGNFMLLVALPYQVYQLTHSALDTGLLFICQTLPGFLFGSFAGVFVDRWNRQRLMIVTNILAGLTLLPLLAVHSAEQVWIVYIVGFLLATISQLFSPAENALLPKLVSEEDLATANSLNQLNNSLAMVSAPVLGGLTVTQFGLQGVVVVDSLSYFVAALMISAIHIADQVPPAAAQQAQIGSFLETWFAGIHLAKTSLLVMTIFIASVIAGFGEGIFQVIFAPYLFDRLGVDAIRYGWILTARAIGGMVGALLVAQLARLFLPSHLWGIGLCLIGILAFCLALFPEWRIAALSFALIGPPAVAAYTGMQTLLQQGVEDHFLGRIFGSLGAISALAVLIGQGVASVVGDQISVLVMISIAGTCYTFAGIYGFVQLRRLPAPAATTHLL